MPVRELNEIELGDLCQSAIECFSTATGRISQFPKMLARVIETRAWERREHFGRVIELPGLRDLITRKPIEGWGEDPSKIEAVIRDEPAILAAFREAMKGKPGRKPKPAGKTDNNVIPLDTPQGNARAFSIDRVQRLCDAETVEAVMAGEMSPNAALVRAGIRENRQVYLPRDPAKAVEKLRKAFGQEFVEAMKEAMDGR